MIFLAGKPIQVGIGQWPALAQDVPVRVVEVVGDDDLVPIDQAGHVAVAVRVVESVLQN